MVGGKESQKGTETKDDRKEDKDAGWSNPVGESVDLGVHDHSMPTDKVRESKGKKRKGIKKGGGGGGKFDYRIICLNTYIQGKS